MGKIETFRYVGLGEVGRYLAEGWVIADDFAGIHHGNWSVLMRLAEQATEQVDETR